MAIAPELAYASLRTLGQKLRAKEFSAVELAEFFLERLEKLGPKLNAVVTVTRKLALDQAAQADRDLAAGRDRGPLHGIPYGAKDLLAAVGYPTTWGAAPYREQTFDHDATVVERLREAGAVLVAKLAMVEIAGGLGYDQANASFTGPGLSPWNVGAWSGGSSSGSGSAVGAGLVPLAIGSETWGSIVTPATFCGITGLRPTYGRVSRHGAMALTWSLDKLGPMGRTADDCGLALAAIAGPDPRDATSIAELYRYDTETLPKPPYKLALLKDELEHVQPEVRANFEKSLEILKPHAIFEEIELPDLPYGVVAATIIDCELSAAFEGLLRSGDLWEMTAPEDRLGLQAPMFIPARDYINAQRIRAQIGRALDEVLAKFDAIVTPTMPCVATPIDAPFAEYHRRWRGGEVGGAGNAAGLPALCLPNGFGERNLPTGLQFVGRAREENRLLALGRLYQEATDWHARRPPDFS